MATRRPKFYFSFRSPYSWIAARQLEERYGLGPNEIDYVPFFEPDETSRELLARHKQTFPYTPMSKDKHLYILQDIGRITRELGYALQWPVDTDPWWEPAHLGYLAAQGHPHQHDLFWGLYRARWEEGRDISRPETIAQVATEVGLNGPRCAYAANDESVRAAGLHALRDVCRTGVFGVPYFTVGYDRYWGIDRLPLFVERIRVQCMRGSTDRPTTTPVTSLSMTELDHAGGCG